MSVFILPLDSVDPAYTVDVDLSGTIYRLTFVWTARTSLWTMDIGTPDAEEPIAAGMPVMVDWDMMSQHTDTRLPPGIILALDTGGNSVNPGEFDLGARVILVYDDGLG